MKARDRCRTGASIIANSSQTGLLNWLQAKTGAGLLRIDAATRALHWQPQVFVLHGLPPGAAQPTLEQALQRIASPDRDALRAAIDRLLAGDATTADLELELLLPNLSRQRVRLQLEAETTDGRCTALLGCLQPCAPAVAPALLQAMSDAGIGLWEIDLRDGSEHWSDRTLAIYGLPPGSPAPSRAEWRSRYLHPGDVERAAVRAQALEQHGRPYELDYRIRLADGSLRWLHSRAAFAPGQSHRLIGLTLDITERKRDEERAAESWRALDLSATQIGFGYGFRDFRTEAVHWSSQLKRIYGLHEDDPTPGRSQFLALVVPEHRDVVSGMIQPSAISQPASIEFDIVRRSDGRRRSLISRAVIEHDEQGRPLRRFFAVLDVTEQHERDRERGRALEHLRLATQSTGIGTWERDGATGQARWDDTERSLYGLPPGVPAPDVEGFLQLVHPDDRERLRGAFEAPPPADGVSGHEFRVVRPDGQVRWLLTRGSLLLEPDGRIRRRVGITLDVTRLREAEAALQAKEIAERANQAKTEFLSRMSHELRTPLNAVLGFAQILALDEHEPLSATQLQRIGHIQTAGWHLLALINDVLDLSRIESREIRIEMQSVALAPLLHEVFLLNEDAAKRQGVRLQAEPLPEAARAFADPTRLRQVLVNLVSNAIKYNRAGGEVEVGLRQQQHQGAPGQALWVRDSGEGMNAAQLGALFQPFNRLGRERGGVEGTGIGLTLSKHLIERMDGALLVHSEPGIGSEFVVWLPQRETLG